MYVDVVSAAVEEKSAQLFYSIGPAGGFHIGLLALSGVVYAGFIGIDELMFNAHMIADAIIALACEE